MLPVSVYLGGRIGTSCAVARFVPFRFVSPRPRFGTLRYVCSAVHLLAQYRGGIIITAPTGPESRDASPFSMIAIDCDPAERVNRRRDDEPTFV